MKIPSSFQLAGVTWRVLEQSNTNDLGFCERDAALIVLKREMSTTTKEIALLHELIHAIKYTQGDIGPHDEKDVDSFAYLLHQFMTSQK